MIDAKRLSSGLSALGKAKRKEKNPGLPEKLVEYSLLEAALADRLRTWRTVSYLLSGCLAIWVLVSWRQLDYKDKIIAEKDAQLAERPFITYSADGAVASAPNTIHPSGIRNWFNNTITYLNTFNHSTVAEIYGYLERGMTTDLRKRFHQNWNDLIVQWRKDEYEQSIRNFSPVTTYYRIEDKFVHLAHLKLDREMHGRPIRTEDRFLKLTLKARTFPNPLTNAMVDIADIQWLKEQEYRNEKHRLERHVADARNAGNKG